MTYYNQQTRFTCGPASIRNCLLSFGYNYSEKRIRNFAGTDREFGTNEKNIFRALKVLGFKHKEFFSKGEQIFRKRVLRNIKKGHKLIILTDHEDHWISIVNYSNKKLEIVDTNRKRVKLKLTPKELSTWCLNFNKRTKESYYYGIIIYKPKEKSLI